MKRDHDTLKGADVVCIRSTYVVKSPTNEIKRPIYIKRDLYTSKEACVH